MLLRHSISDLPLALPQSPNRDRTPTLEAPRTTNTAAKLDHHEESKERLNDTNEVSQAFSDYHRRELDKSRMAKTSVKAAPVVTVDGYDFGFKANRKNKRK